MNWNSVKIIRMLTPIIIFVLFEFSISRIYCFTLYPDEFGYWASAAKLVGYDWTQMSSAGSYYGYGYSLILAPILLVVKEGVAAYRIGILINFLFIYVTSILLGFLISNLYSDGLCDTERLLIVIVGAFYPSWLFYSQTTMVESYLMFLYVILAYLISRLYKDDMSIGLYIAIAIILGYLPMVHLRTVGIVMAGVVTVIGNSIYSCIATNEKIIKIGILLRIAIFSFMLIAMLSMGIAIKNIVQNTVYMYADSEILAVNEYRGVLSRVLILLRSKNLLVLARTLFGKVFYILSASYGLPVLLIFAIVRRNKERRNRENVVFIFVALSTLFMLLVSSVYVGNVDSVDSLVYGRYVEISVPVIIVLGICELIDLCRKRTHIRNLIETIVITKLGLLAYVMYVVDDYAIGEYRGYHAVALSYLVNSGLTIKQQLVLYTSVSSFLLLIIVVVAKTLSAGNWRCYGLTLVICGQIIMAFLSSDAYVYMSNRCNYYDLAMVGEVVNQTVDNDDITYAISHKDRQAQYIFGGLIQMQYPTKSIRVVSLDDERIREADLGEIIFLNLTDCSRDEYIDDAAYNRRVLEEICEYRSIGERLEGLIR